MYVVCVYVTKSRIGFADTRPGDDVSLLGCSKTHLMKKTKKETLGLLLVRLWRSTQVSRPGSPGQEGNQGVCTVYM